MSSWSQVSFQDANSFMMMELVFFHDFIMVVLVGIIVGVAGILLFSMRANSVNLNFMESQFLETLWTVFPGVILVLIAIPSINLLYLFEEFSNYDTMVRATGFQWFWVYEYCFIDPSGAHRGIFESFLKTQRLLENQSFRLLETHHSLLLPNYVNIQLLVSSADVLHSWAIPTLGIKVDAIPGRINSSNFNPIRFGTYFGQCSEICGSYHSFMPIKLQILNIEDYYTLCYWH